MSTGSFTAGSWAISGVLEGRGDITISSGRLVVATAHNGVSFFDVINSRDPEQQWANAHLIAAAPELLEALVQLCASLDKINDPQWKGSPDEIAARAAIAKARGDA